ncbi:MAG TPA: septal ring lytic transglycosylase RlpA family protein [Allosphingosinicella sp.]|jgi:rare lipoprotein A
MIRKMRSSAVRTAATLALAGLLTTGAAPAVAAQDSGIADLAETVRTLEDPAVVEGQPEFKLVGQGEASYYGHELAGNRTASGERFNPQALTAAHRTLPLGTKLRVTNKANGKSVIVRVNDRGPFVGRRIIDLSLAAAQQLGFVRAGRGQVTLETLRTA